jgi:hypothetical protein
MRLLKQGDPGAGTHGRFVVLREVVQTKKPAVGRKLIDLPGYVFRVFVTNRNDAVLDHLARLRVSPPTHPLSLFQGLPVQRQHMPFYV